MRALSRRPSAASVDTAAAIRKIATNGPVNQLNRSPITSATASPSGPVRAPPPMRLDDSPRWSAYQLPTDAAPAISTMPIACGQPSSEASTTIGA